MKSKQNGSKRTRRSKSISTAVDKLVRRLSKDDLIAVVGGRCIDVPSKCSDAN